MTYPEHAASAEELHEEQSRGWYFPIQLVRLYEEEIINAEDLMLLGKINALSHPSKGCWATNGWLAEWWGKTPNWVGATISEFVKLGLVRIELRRGNRRHLFVTYQGDADPSQKSVRVTEKCEGPHRKVWGSSQKSVRATDITEKHKREHAAPRRAATGTERNGFDLEEVEQPPMLQFARSFAKWSTKHNLHALQRGSTKAGWKPTTVKAWSRIAQSLLLSLNEDVDRIKAVWKWYQLHYGDDYVPECRTLKSFCERFLSIEAAMRRAARPLSRKAQAAQEEEDIGTGTRITDEFLERQGIDPKSVRRVARYQEGDELR